MRGRGQLAPQLIACLGVLSRLRTLLLSTLEKPLRATYRLALRALVRRLASAPRKAIRLASKSDTPTQPALFVRRVGRRLAIYLRFQLPTGRPLSIRLRLPARLAPLEPSHTDTAELQPSPLPAPRAEGHADESDVTRERLRAADSANPLPAAAAQLRLVQQQQLSLLPLRALSTRSGKTRQNRAQRAALSNEKPSGGSEPSEAPTTFAPDELEIALRSESSGLSRAQRKRMRTQLVAALSKTRRN